MRDYLNSPNTRIQMTSDLVENFECMQGVKTSLKVSVAREAMHDDVTLLKE